jgi:predicted TIM-barrel fold metal-dependent hydrolase
MSELRIIDADGHVREAVSASAEYLEPPFGKRKFFFPLWPGDDHIVFPTDFPHSFTFERLVDLKDLPGELSRKILWDNPKRLYGI